eukprot:g17225.t1
MALPFDPERLVKHESPIPPRVYGEVALVTLSCGFILLAFFMLHEVTASRMEYNAKKQIGISAVASGFLGVGFRKLHAELDKAPLDCALSSMKLHCKKREAKLQKLKQVGNLLCSFAQDLVHSEKVAKEYFSLPCSDPRTQPIATKDTSCPAADRTQQKLEAFHRKHDEAFYLPFSTTAKQFLAKTNAHQFQAVVVKNSGGGEADAAFVQFLKAQLRGGSQTGGGELYVLGRHLLAVRSFREEFSEKLRARIETNFLKHIDAGLCFGGEEWSWLEPDADSFSGAVEKIVRVSLDELDGSGGAAETDPQSFVFAQVLGKLQPIIKSNLGPWGAVNWLEQIKAIGGGSLDQPFSADAFQKEAVGQKDRMSEQQDKTEVSEVELEELANAILAKEEFSAFFGRLNGAGEGQGCGTGANAGLELPQGQPERQTEASAGKQPAPAEKEPETKCGAGSKAESKSDTVAKPQARGGAVSKPDAKGGAGSKADPTCATVSKPGASFGSGAKPDAKGGAGAKPNEKASAGAKIDSKYTATGSKPDARGGTGSKPGAKGSAGAKAASKRGICGGAPKGDAKSSSGAKASAEKSAGSGAGAKPGGNLQDDPKRSGGSEHGAEQIGNYPKELGKRANEPDSADIGARGSKASAKQSSSMKDAEAGKLNKNPRLVQLKGEQFALRFLMELYRRRQREAKSKSNAEGHATGTGVAGNQNQGSPKQPEEPKAACEKCLQRFKENGNTWPKVNTNEKDKDGKPKEKDLFCRPVSTSQCLEARERCRRGEQPPEAKSRNQAGGGVHGFGPDGKVESIDISK